MFLYLALMTSTCGLSACIFRMDFMLESFSGNNAKLITTVTTTMAQPKLCTTLSLNQLTTRNSGLARMRHPAEIDQLFELRVDALEQVVILGADENPEVIHRAHGDGRAGVRRRLLDQAACAWCRRT